MTDFCSSCEAYSKYLIRVNHYWEETMEDGSFKRDRVDELVLCPDCFKAEVLDET